MPELIQAAARLLYPGECPCTAFCEKALNGVVACQGFDRVRGWGINTHLCSGFHIRQLTSRVIHPAGKQFLFADIQ